MKRPISLRHYTPWLLALSIGPALAAESESLVGEPSSLPSPEAAAAAPSQTGARPSV